MVRSVCLFRPDDILCVAPRPKKERKEGRREEKREEMVLKWGQEDELSEGCFFRSDQF